MTDTIITQMADEAIATLRSHGLDPANPPSTSIKPPARLVFSEYQNRGGAEYTDEDKFTGDLVELIKSRAAEGG